MASFRYEPVFEPEEEEKRLSEKRSKVMSRLNRHAQGVLVASLPTHSLADPSAKANPVVLPPLLARDTLLTEAIDLPGE